MQAKIRELYPQKNRIFYMAFDISLLLYFIAYFVFYTDDTVSGSNYGRIRLIATLLLLFFGACITLFRMRTVSEYIIWYGSFIFLGIISMIWAQEDGNITSILPSLIRLLAVIVFIFVRVRTKTDVEIILNLYVIAQLILVFHVTIEMVNYFSLTTFFLRRFGQNIGYNPNMIAMGGVVAFLILLHKVNCSSKTSLKILQYVAIVLFISAIVLTGSKKGLLGAVLGVFLLSYYRNKGVRKLRIVFVFGIALVIVWLLIMNVPSLYNAIGSRIETMFALFTDTSEVDGSTAERFDLMIEAVKIWGENPVLGCGLNNYSIHQTVAGVGYYAHNNYLELLADLGIVGFLLYYSMPLKLVVQKVKIKDDLTILVKCLLIVILFLDVAMISYIDIRIQVIYCISYLVLMRTKKREE